MGGYVKRFIAISLLAWLSSGCVADLEEDKPVETTFGGGAVRVRRNVRSWKNLTEKGIVMQSYDFSCGSAALATLMRYYFQDDVTERDVLEDLLEFLSDEEIQQRQENGLTMLDLKLCAQRMGYQAVGVRLKASVLPQLQGPILIHLEREGYKHFAVLRGVRNDRVFLADPSRGNIRVKVHRFLEQWTDIALVLGKKGAGLPDDYPLKITEDWAVHDSMLVPVRSRYLLSDTGSALVTP